MSDFVSNIIVEELSPTVAAIFQEETKRILDYEEVKPKDIKNGYRGYVPWGDDNKMPKTILGKIRADEVMSSNMWFNITTCYGRGFTYSMKDGSPISNPDILRFFKRNNMIKYWIEQITDLKHFNWAVMLLHMDRNADKIVKIQHIDNVHVRFETCDKKNGKIEHIFIANWEDNPRDETTEAIPLLDEDDPIGDLMIRLGKEPASNGKKNAPTKDRIFAIVTKLPTPGLKYYPIPYYFSTFQSGWARLKAMIPATKIARLKNGMSIKYLVELDREYFSKIYSDEKITDPAAQKERKKQEVENIKNFISGHENQNKSWISTLYVDPNGKEQHMVKINVIDNKQEGGEYIADSEEASNIVSYAMGVHPSLIGSSPGKSKNINGTEARELFTMKQGLEKLTRDLMLIPFEVLNDVNGWDLKYEIPDLLLTTLDKGTDAIPSNKLRQPIEEEDDDPKKS